ncbi:hypothetical protein ACFOMD_14130 [Sphingoaurantiacus capsulatus]|uniref:Lipoprotein n=1 Tax=Sphingoaurantiacus capsulatus TaxID=1771310 RepID=A0ABV7XC37_9SPHN
MIALLLAASVAATCSTQTGTDAAHRAAVEQFIENAGNGQFVAMGAQLAPNAVWTDAVEEKSIPAATFLTEISNAAAGARVDGVLEVLDMMSDGSDTIAAKVRKKSDGEVEDNLYVFEVGGGCITRVHLF